MHDHRDVLRRQRPARHCLAVEALSVELTQALGAEVLDRVAVGGVPAAQVLACLAAPHVLALQQRQLIGAALGIERAIERASAPRLDARRARLAGAPFEWYGRMVLRHRSRRARRFRLLTSPAGREAVLHGAADVRHAQLWRLCSTLEGLRHLRALHVNG
eukprot:4021617-Prymnesium_polylepis.1